MKRSGKRWVKKLIGSGKSLNEKSKYGKYSTFP